jgi:hypothetical protein
MTAHVLPLFRLRPTCLALMLLFASSASAQETIHGVESWAEAQVGLSTTKWVGPRVDFPLPTTRPSGGRLDSLRVPVRVHAGHEVSAARAERVLEVLEGLVPLLDSAGFFASAGMHDVYLVANAAHGADAGIDLSTPYAPYDGAYAFALLDARTPEAQVEVCTTQAFVEARLYELDPAEAQSVRKASAAYFAWLVTGDAGCDDDWERALEMPALDPFADPERAGGALWFARLGARQDQNRGVTLRELWDFARQRTWEGVEKGLRASPDLFECIAQLFVLGREELEHVAGELAEQRYLSPYPLGLAPMQPNVVHWDALPGREIPEGRVIEQLGASYLWVALDKPRVGEQLKVWSRGELGTRWTLIATRLDARRNVIGRVSAPARRNPNSYVILELDGQTTDVLITLVNVADGIPDADLANDFFDHGAEIIAARGNGPGDPEPVNLDHDEPRPITIGVGPQ